MSRKTYNGIIVYNKNDAEKNTWFIEKMIDDALVFGLNLKLVFSDEITEETLCDFAIMRDRDYKLSQYLEKRGVQVFNNSTVSKICNDKLETYNYFKDKSIPLMYTQRSKLPYPFVLKPRDGHGGAFVYLIENSSQYDAALDEIKRDYFNPGMQNDELQNAINESFIYQIKASETGKDTRVYVLGDLILTSMQRESSSDFRANFSLGGHAKEVALNDEELKIVSKVKSELNIDFGGIDIIYNNDHPVLNEIEDVVGTRMLYKYTDIDACREYIKWIAEKLMEKEV